jgi:hypothetical protein
MKHLVVCVLFLVACKDRSGPAKEKPPAATPAASARSEACTAALKSFDRFVDTGDPNGTPDQHAKVKAAVLDRCMTDNWSDPALACMRAANNSQDVFKCWNEQLTKEQREAASKSLGNLKQ